MTLGHVEEYLESELKVENAVVPIDLDSLPDRYMIESRIWSILSFFISSIFDCLYDLLSLP